jgi:hypothetical protein
MESKVKTSNRKKLETHEIYCKTCGVGKQASINTTAFTCWECIAESWTPEDAPKRKSVGFPKGWKFMKQFVHENGTVYIRGEEQPELKGTLQPTALTPKEPKVKKSKAQRATEKQEASVNVIKLKKQLAKETRVTYRKKIESQIKQLQKLI